MSDWPGQYRHFPNLTASSGNVTLRPLRWEDREPIRLWRNDQIDVLRQTHELSKADQDRYYRDVIRPQFDQEHPAQILWAVDENEALIGYGGLVHIVWPDRRGEVSFLTETTRSTTLLERDWTAFLDVLVPMARDRLGLHKLTTETYVTRRDVIPLLESHGFQREGTLREHHRIGTTWVDSLAHGLILD